MADNSTGLLVKSLATETVRAKLVDTGGTNEVAISAANAMKVDASSVPVPITDNAASLTVDAPVATPVYARLSDGGAALVGQKVMASSLPVALASDQTALPITDNAASLTVDAPVATPVYVRLSDGAANLIGQKVMASSLPVTIASDQSGSLGGTQYVGDAAITATPTGTVAMGLASAAAPGAVSADNDAVSMWMLRNGSPVMNLASGGTLVTVGAKAMAASLPVVLPTDGVLADATHPGYVRLTDGAAVLIGQKAMAGSVPVTIASDQTGFTSTQYVGDAAITATPTGTVDMGLAHAAAPVDVSADNDAVAQWMLRNGSAVMNLASGGTLVTVGAKTMANSLPIVFPTDGVLADATHPGYVRLTDGAAALIGQAAMAASLPVAIASNQTALPSNLTQVGGSSISATVPLSVRMTDGVAYYTLMGQTAATAPYSRINDGTTTAGVIVGTTALKTDLSSVAGAVPSATNPIPVRITDGAAFYSAASSAPTLPTYSTKTSAALGAGAPVDLTHYVTSGKTGQLMGIDVSSTVALKVVINTEVTAAKTARVVLFTPAGIPISWRSPSKTFITRASADATSGFSVTITNKDATVAADVYSTAYWDEV